MRFILSILFIFINYNTFANYLQIEVIAFANLFKDTTLNEEYFPLNPGFPDFTNSKKLSAVNEREDILYKLLPKDEKNLNTIATKIINSKNYKLLMHSSWLHEKTQLKTPIKIYLTGDNNYLNKFNSFSPIQELEGTLSINYTRFPHVNLDFIFRDFNLLINPKASLFTRHFADYFSGNTIWRSLKIIINQDKFPPNFVSFRLQENRKLKLDQVSYIDHPKFALLIKITEHKDRKESDNE